jgi:hypothetical protein
MWWNNESATLCADPQIPSHIIAAPVPALARRAITVSGLQVLRRRGFSPCAPNHIWIVVNRPDGELLVKIGRSTRHSGGGRWMRLQS